MNLDKSYQQPSGSGLLVNVLINIVVPVIVLMRYSGEAHLGPTLGLIVAISFPLTYGLWELISARRVNFFSLIGVISVLATGGIGLLELDARYIAFKEAAVPAIIGLAALILRNSRYAFIRVMLYNEHLLNLQKIKQALAVNGCETRLNARLSFANWMLTGSFFLSAVLNYVLATMLVTSQAGSQAFNEELGRMMALSYPVIALPCLAITMVALIFLIAQIKRLTKLQLEHIFNLPKTAAKTSPPP